MPHARRRRIAESLEYLDRRSRLLRDPRARETFFRLLMTMHSKAVLDVLVRLLRDARLTTADRIKAVSVLALRYPGKAYGLFRNLLLVKDIPATVRAQMVRELGKGSTRNEGSLLRKLLADTKESLTVRIACAEALINWPSLRSRKLLRMIAENPRENPMLRKAAREALAKLERKSKSMLRRQ